MNQLQSSLSVREKDLPLISESQASFSKSSSKVTENEKDVNSTIPKIGEIRKVLPADVFESSLFLSMAYVVRTLFLIVTLGSLFALYDNAFNLTQQGNTGGNFPLFSLLIHTAVVCVYAFFQGVLFWSVFTLGHDAGHSSFSRYDTINWIVGLCLHTSILVPYQAWRLSHKHHHSATGNMDRDEIFFPQRERKRISHYMVLSLGFAWFIYLLTGYGDSPRIHHLNPFDRLFSKNLLLSLLSTGSLAAFAYFGVYQFGVLNFGWLALSLYYFLPLLVFASWLVITTFLHHNEPDAPWYGDQEWSWVRGNLSSIDRDYFPFNSIINNIGTHQIHHLFPSIPHYNLVRATKAFRKAFPHLVRKSDKNPLHAFYTNVVIYLTAKPPTVDTSVYVYKDHLE
mmetsp:Transcript_4043/g.6061  ORF Transcript_4043/g.6061 Transcript_4043/m.6061 type:complete len:396 (+) Transcript_4043:48-1235(+)